MSNGKIIKIRLIVGQIKKMLYKTSNYPELDSYSRNKINFELDVSNYSRKSEVKKATVVDKSNFIKG